jgi:hypothetical protein
MVIKIIQLLILGLSILGTILVFYNSPFYSSSIYAPTIADADKFYKRDLNKKRLAKIGFGLIIFSYLLQTIIIFIHN